MRLATDGRVWNFLGWSGTVLFLMTWLELAVPAARRLLASILPLQVFACLLVASGLCIAAGIVKKRWFLLPGLAALASVLLLLVSVFSE